MEDKVKLLIAVGASFTANCQSCLNTAVTQAEASGVQKKEILEAIAIGRVVRKGAIGKIDKLAATLTGKTITDSPDDCPFGTTEEDVKEWVNQEDQCDCSQPGTRQKT
jgi:AhpD family alkylhydroperoxidase